MTNLIGRVNTIEVVSVMIKPSLVLVDFGARLRDARIARGISQAELGRLIGKSKQLVSAWENGAAEMTWTTLASCVKALNIDPNWLMFGVGSDRGSAHGLPHGTMVPFLTRDEVIQVARGDLNASDASSRTYCYFTISGTSFALECPDTSMDSEDRHAIRRGELAFVDPSKKVEPGDKVVAYVTSENGTRLVEPVLSIREIRFLTSSIGHPPYDLVPRSPAWPTMSIKAEGDATILGVVVANLRPI